MLHADAERRISEILKLSALFKEKGYLETANQISAFTNILRGKEIPVDFLEKLGTVFDVFQIEFEKRLSVGQNYRKKVFQEIASTTLKAIGRMKTDYPQALLSIFPLFQRLRKGSSITGEIGEELARGGIKDKNVIFHIRCYAYLIIVEGIYD